MARTRRSKEEVLTAKIAKCDEEIAKYNEKVLSMTEEKNKIKKELEELRNAQKKAERAAKLNELADLMDSKGYTIDDLEKLMSMPKPVVEEVEQEEPKTEE